MAPRFQRQVHGSKLINGWHRLEQLGTLLEVEVAKLKLTCLFSTRINGWNPTTFHNLCDNEGPTITFVQGPNGAYYGGYASVDWQSYGSFTSDAHAFLFRCSAQGQQPEKIHRSGHGLEVYDHPGYGPVFGRKQEFFSFGQGGDILQQPSGSGGNSSFNLTGSFINSSVAKTAANFQLEVLQISHYNPADGDLGDPWLSDVSWEPEVAQSLWQQVIDFDPQQQGLQVGQINLLLCGGVGAGKSSIVCTVDSLCKGRKSDRASHGQGSGSLSRQLRKYGFKNPKTAQPAKWCLWDTMGWGVKDYKKGELEYILDGNLPDRCKLDSVISTRTPGFQHEPTADHKVHCVCFVVPCSSATDKEYMERFCEMRDLVRSRDIRFLVLLTKIDMYDPDIVGEDLSKTYHSARLQSVMEGVLDSSGAGGLNDIYPIQNLSREATVSVEAGILLCRGLQAALYAAVDYLEDQPESMDLGSASAYTATESEKMAIANKDHSGRNGVLSLIKDHYYWVIPSATQAGWLLGHNGDGKTGRILERMVNMIDVATET